MRRKHGVPLWTVCASLAAGPLLAGCGWVGGGLAERSGPEVSEQAGEALRSAESLRVRISLDGGTDSATEVDLTLDDEGNCRGTVAQAGEGSAELVRRGNEVWLRPDEAFWKSRAGAAGENSYALFRGRYLHGSVDDPVLGGLSGTCDLAGLRESSAETGGDWGAPRTGTLDGVRVVSVTRREKHGSTTLHVAREGTPYPVRVDKSGAEESGTMRFSDFGTPVPTRVPSAAESVDVDELRRNRARGTGAEAAPGADTGPGPAG
ncbi:hypothetical protein QNO07_04885 [Streptomyces sp. 549]|uniref:hypothetical protein n=1 Tax=Streptomyces sp. 549 TaxID=3049076 RepID=UPI0024C3985D|nr:hypothetical protein [Streptomyces sp. 549]MDK1472769.1 hypothetical protein [Streptomyces sp. 549]